MFLLDDEVSAYSTILLGISPYVTQLSISSISWILIFPIIVIPALSLLLSIGHLSNTGPLLTFKRIAPIAAGLGWAMTWHIGERLYLSNLRAAQNLLYLIFSVRLRLDWALDCEHSYNSRFCVPFEETNLTEVKPFHQYPNNFWPTQEFNRYMIRDNRISVNISTWEPNEWLWGSSKDPFYLSLPSFPLLISHLLIWLSVYAIIYRSSQIASQFLFRLCVLLPAALYIILLMGMTTIGVHFTGSNEEYATDAKIDQDPFDFWLDVKGLYRTSLVMVDYSGIFTGLILFATSRLRPGAVLLNPYIILPTMMLVPTCLTLLRTGCEGRVMETQPQYKVYLSTGDTVSYDLLPVCFALTHGGPFWSLLYYSAQLLYTSIGPMVIYCNFIYQTFVDEFPVLHNNPQLFYAALAAFFTIPSIFLYMPLGTKIILLVEYASQSALTQILAYVIIYLVYGWQTIETDVLTMTNDTGNVGLWKYLTRSTSPILTVLCIMIIPALLCAKYTAVFDLLLSGGDVIQHLSNVDFIFPSGFRFIGIAFNYVIMFGPIVIVTSFASWTIYYMIVKHKLSFSEVMKPTSDWMAHGAVNGIRPRPHSLAYGFYNSFIRMSYPTAILGVFIVEFFIGLLLLFFLVMNLLSLSGLLHSPSSNNYRASMLLLFVCLHGVSLVELRLTQVSFNAPHRLNIYIGVAIMETAMLNGYMWMFVSDHGWGIDSSPILLIIINCMIRGTLIAIAIATRAHIQDTIRPTRTRDATEIYEPDTGIDMDGEDDSPVIFDLARA